MTDKLKTRYAADSGSGDLLILTDQDDNILGYEEKARCHYGTGLLHRALSIFIFNSSGQLLLQRRSASKPLWPLFWSNSVCSHPRKGEETHEAAARRLTQEIGVQAPLRFLFTFQYQAAFENTGSENELCSVFIGKSDGPFTVDPQEIAEWRFVTTTELDQDLSARPHIYTPWFKLEWQTIKKNHMGDVQALLDRES